MIEHVITLSFEHLAMCDREKGTLPLRTVISPALRSWQHEINSELLQREQPSSAGRTYKLDRFINVMNLADQMGNVRLNTVGEEVLKRWGWVIVEELRQIRPGIVEILLPVWDEESRESYETLMRNLDADMLRNLSLMCLSEVKKRGLQLGASVEETVPGDELHHVVKEMIASNPSEAIDAFASLEKFCGGVRREMEALLTPPPAPPPTVPPTTPPFSNLSRDPAPGSRLLPWSRLRVWIHVDESHEEVTHPVDKWRWLHLLQVEGIYALARCGIYLTDQDGDDGDLPAVDGIDWGPSSTEPIEFPALQPLPAGWSPAGGEVAR